jgi:ribonucleoside-diphosphate reductase alpha chain
MEGNQFLHHLVSYIKYARYTDNTYKHKETFNQAIDRSLLTLKNKAYQVSTQAKNDQKEKFNQDFEAASKAMHNGLLLPSMRLIQFAGGAVERNNQRIFNCTYKAITKIRDISDIFYMLLCGCGVGYSVRYRHIKQMPEMADVRNKSYITYTIPDTIEGWAEAVRLLLEGYLVQDAPLVRFDYSLIRPAGSILSVTGGVAPGPEPLKTALEKVESVLQQRRQWEMLTSLELSDIICILAHCVLSGGNRRSALIALFDFGDTRMETCKHGDWYVEHPYRARANFSAMRYVEDMDNYYEYYDFWKRSFESGFGEPGQIITNCPDGLWGVNPCTEIALQDGGCCNLCEINASKVESEAEFYAVCRQASLIGTIQATFTDFTYVSPEWRKRCEEEALLGVGITGIHSSAFMMRHYENGTLGKILERGAEEVKQTNLYYSKLFNIRSANRLTTIKPAGSTSCIFCCSSGIHPIYAPYFIRRVRLSKLSNLYDKIVEKYPSIIEDANDNPEYDAVVSIPIQMQSPIGKYTQQVSALEQIEMARYFTEHWIEPGHVQGTDKHAVSLTVHFKPEERDAVIERMYELRYQLQHVSIFPMWEGKYPQQVFEEISAEEYERLSNGIRGVNDLFNNLSEHDFLAIDASGACDGGICELNL